MNGDVICQRFLACFENFFETLFTNESILPYKVASYFSYFKYSLSNRFQNSLQQDYTKQYSREQSNTDYTILMLIIQNQRIYLINYESAGQNFKYIKQY